MASFGSFETDREVYSGPAYTVYSARRNGDPTGVYAVKVFAVQHPSFDPDAAIALEGLIGDIERLCAERIEVQNRAAQSSKFVSAILESGQDNRGVWYATNFYPRSVNKIISGRVALTAEALHHIIISIASGALDLKRVCGRAHGDIQPSNVQIGKSDKLTDADVVLSDPLPPDAAKEQNYEALDLHSIGLILLQLVLQREISEEKGFHLVLPILTSPEWTKTFGKSADRWLALCNRLLEPNPSLEEFNLDGLVAELEALRPKPAVSRGMLLAGAAMLVLLIGGGIFASVYFKRGHLLVTTEPPGADIQLEVNGEFKSFGKTPDDNSGLAIRWLQKGPYKLRASVPGLPEQVDAVTVEGGKSRSYQFKFPGGRVRIVSSPANASVELDGQVVGTTPYTSPFLPPGPQNYIVRLDGHQTLKFPVTIPSTGEVIPLEGTLSELPRDGGQVEFHSVPDGATIREGNVVLGTTPLPRTLPAGLHTITAQFQDWPPVTREINVVAGANPVVRFNIPHGIARFDVMPPDAEIFLNERSIGRDVRRRVLSPAEYTLRVSHPAYEPTNRPLTIIDGVTTNILVRLKAMLGIVEFTTDPPGAVIVEARAPDRELGRTQAGQPLRREFQPGRYSFIARYEGLDPVESRAVDLVMGTNISLVLPFRYGTVRFETEPAEADVLIGTNRVGRTPFAYRQKPGPVSYRVEMPDYYPSAGTHDLAAGTTVPVSLRLRPRDVNVVLRSDPPGAQFFLGETPLTGTNEVYSLPWGDHTITARYPGPAGFPGVESRTDVVPVDRAGNTSMKFELEYAVLSITNEEPDARVVYQGKPIASLPARLYVKPNFQYDLAIEVSDFKTNLPPIMIAARNSFVPRITLPELRRTYTNQINMVMIRVTKDMYVGRFEVTEAEYRAIMTDDLENRPEGRPLDPITSVTWTNAALFCERLTKADALNLQKARLAGWTYSLPTDGDWALMVEPDAGQLAEAVFNHTGSQVPMEIDPARKSFNKVGIYDLFGNAAEWGIRNGNIPITLGGSVVNRRPRVEQMISSMDTNLIERMVFVEGSPVVGFRCVLKAPR